jgi:hypothetical protein
MPKWLKVCFICALIIALSIALEVFYVPNHWMREMTNFAAVTVDGRGVSADTYLGNPTTNEVDAFLLVHIPSEGNFLFNFDNEDFREIGPGEFVRVYRGAFMIRPMSRGPWFQPLPFLNVDEFRVVSGKRHTIIVRF